MKEKDVVVNVTIAVDNGRHDACSKRCLFLDLTSCTEDVDDFCWLFNSPLRWSKIDNVDYIFRCDECMKLKTEK